jgi:hypothetical protein
VLLRSWWLAWHPGLLTWTASGASSPRWARGHDSLVTLAARTEGIHDFYGDDVITRLAVVAMTSIVLVLLLLVLLLLLLVLLLLMVMPFRRGASSALTSRGGSSPLPQPPPNSRTPPMRR